MQIDLPRFHWLISPNEGKFVTNVYTSSLGTVSDGGCLGTKTFNFKVYADTSSGEEASFKLVAESYIIQPWNMGAEKTDFERAEFECSEEGVRKAAEWLSATSSKYGF